MRTQNEALLEGLRRVEDLRDELQTQNRQLEVQMTGLMQRIEDLGEELQTVRDLQKLMIVCEQLEL